MLVKCFEVMNLTFLFLRFCFGSQFVCKLVYGSTFVFCSKCAVPLSIMSLVSHDCKERLPQV